MKIPKEHKEVILKKVNVLIKEFLVNRYLSCGDHATDDEIDLLKSLAKKLLSVEQNISLDNDINNQFLIWIDEEYKKLFNENMEKQI